MRCFAQNVTFDQMYSFLKENYLHSRFSARDGVWSNEGVHKYSEIVAISALNYLQKYGHGYIGIYESRSGRGMKYDENLFILNPDEPPAQIETRSVNSWYRASI